jgi:catechol 2,3-dioxygenase-like lactoylglutathione lyase family enzyme
MTKLSHVEINVSQYAKSIRFYDQVLIPLGWKRLVCQTSHTTFTDGAMKLVLCPAEEEHLHHGYHRKRIGLNHLAFYAPSKKAVDEIYENLHKENKIPALYEGQPAGEDSYYAVFFEDPDRIKIEVVYAPGYCGPEHYTNRLEDNFDPYAEQSS